MEAAAEIQQCCGIPVVFLFAHTEGEFIEKNPFCCKIWFCGEKRQ